MSKYTLSSVVSVNELMLDYFKISNAIWDYMHDTMKYDDEVCHAITVMTKYLCNLHNELLHND